MFVPRRFPLPFRHGVTQENHYAFFGTATVKRGFPLYADAANEYGLAGAGLNFPALAHYPNALPSEPFCISPFELLPWTLCQCKSLAEAKSLLAKTRLVNEPFDSDTPLTPLHFHFADETGSICVESTKDGFSVYDNPLGVLANNPTFPFHLTHYAAYAHLSETPCPPSPHAPPFFLGLGALGLPGDYSSPSRFVKAAWLRERLEKSETEEEVAARCFELLAAVSPPKGAVVGEDGNAHFTVYACCLCGKSGSYRYQTHRSPCVRTIHTRDFDYDGQSLIVRGFEK